jgi:hypothetical protein
VVAWTVPPRGTVLSSSGLRRTAQGAVASWELSAPVDWPQYQRWIGQGGRPGYRPIVAGGGSLSFSRLDSGDQLLVEILAVVPNAPVKIRVTFTGRPK